MTVLENLAFANPKASEGAKHELLTALRLVELRDQKPHKLSGGQQQRVALARALVQESSLVLLDEPLSAQDDAVKEDIVKLLSKLKDKKHCAWLVISHQATLFHEVADQFWVLDKGQLVVNG